MPVYVQENVGRKGKTYGVRVTIGKAQFWAGTYKTRTEAKIAGAAAEHQLLTQQLNGQPLTLDTASLDLTPVLTIAQYREQWSQHQPNGRKGEPRTEATWYAHMASTAEFARQYGDLSFDDVDVELAEKWFNARKSDRKALSALWNDAIRNSSLTRATVNPWGLVKGASSPGRANIVPLTTEQIDALVEYSLIAHGDEFGDVFGTWILLMATAGLRPSESIRLKRADLDFERNIIHVRRTLARDKKGNYTVLKLPKGGKARDVVLPPQVRDRLTALPTSPNCEWLFFNKEGDPLFPGSLQTLWNDVRRLCPLVDSGIDKHELRHRAAYWMFGMPEEWGGLRLTSAETAEQLGHSDGGQLIERLYGHPDRNARLHQVWQAMQSNYIAQGGTP